MLFAFKYLAVLIDGLLIMAVFLDSRMNRKSIVVLAANIFTPTRRWMGDYSASFFGTHMETVQVV